MLRKTVPDKIYKVFNDLLNDQVIHNRNIVFIDFDNTLMPWNSKNISKEVEIFLKNLINNNKIVIIASNGKGERFDSLKNNLPENVELINDLRKPTTGKLKKYLKKNGLNPQESVFIGDNLITDIYTANKLGMYTIKVEPISKKEFPLTKIYRIIEVMLKLIYSNRLKI